jgi:hypothetical protein
LTSKPLVGNQPNLLWPLAKLTLATHFGDQPNLLWRPSLAASQTYFGDPLWPAIWGVGQSYFGLVFLYGFRILPPSQTYFGRWPNLLWRPTLAAGQTYFGDLLWLPIWPAGQTYFGYPFGLPAKPTLANHLGHIFWYLDVKQLIGGT